jgi:hypothetical protein
MEWHLFPKGDAILLGPFCIGGPLLKTNSDTLVIAPYFYGFFCHHFLPSVLHFALQEELQCVRIQVGRHPNQDQIPCGVERLYLLVRHFENASV